MRKKAKYLHDAPNEALLPDAGTSYHQIHSSKNTTRTTKTSVVDAGPSPQQAKFLPQTAPTTYPTYPQTFKLDQAQGPRQPQDISNYNHYSTQPSPLSSHFSTHQPSPMQHLAPRGLPHGSPPTESNVQAYEEPLFDANGISPFNFDLTTLNFDNHYGALEFGMLGHMSSGVNGDLDRSHQTQAPTTSFGAPNMSSSGYVDNTNDPNLYPYHRNNPGLIWQPDQVNQGLRMHSYQSNGNAADVSLRRSSRHEPHSYVAGTHPSNLAGNSPASSAHDTIPTYDNNLIDSVMMTNSQQAQQAQQPLLKQKPFRHQQQQIPESQQYREVNPAATISEKLDHLPLAPTKVRKHRRAPSSIYSSVTQPYPYTLGFHALTAVLQRRFSSQKRLSIAQAMASIRPSFISCTKALVNDDLVFMEKCFQRSLLEYEDFVDATGTPTIICRRTGEVAYAGKEFSQLTGWSLRILQGKEPNLNANVRSGSGGASGTMTGGSLRSGVNTPRIPADHKADNAPAQLTRPQPVFLAELLDDDSVVQFYEDFARLAFADSKGSAWSPCKLLKYTTQEALMLGSLAKSRETIINNNNGSASRNASGKREKPKTLSPEQMLSRKRRMSGSLLAGHNDGSSNDKPIISAEDEMPRLGEKEGKVDCMYCWTVRRDVFDIPMAIVINVSIFNYPTIHRVVTLGEN